MSVVRSLLGLLVIVALVALAAGDNVLSDSPGAAPIPAETGGLLLIQQGVTPTPPATNLPAPTPTPTASGGAPLSDLVIWWPAEVMPATGSDAEDELLSQLEGFRQANDLSSLLRVKRLSGPGSIMSTLRTAGSVAPGALPDLVLLTNETLVTAAGTGLIQPLPNPAAAELAAGLYDGIQTLGVVDGEVFGIPYLLTVQHAAYLATEFEAPPETFQAVLGSGQPFALAAGHETLASDALLIQYAAGGGHATDAAGEPLVNENPLREMLTFYATAVEDGQLAPEAAALTRPADAWALLTGGTVALAQVDSSTYLRHPDPAARFAAAALPTANGSAATTVDAWLWALTTADPVRQARALEYLAWVLDADHHAAYSQAALCLPSQPAALQAWADPDYAALIARLITATSLVLPERVNSTTTAAIQAAWTSVIAGEHTPAQAAETAAQEVNGAP